MFPDRPNRLHTALACSNRPMINNNKKRTMLSICTWLFLWDSFAVIISEQPTAMHIIDSHFQAATVINHLNCICCSHSLAPWQDASQPFFGCKQKDVVFSMPNRTHGWSHNLWYTRKRMHPCWKGMNTKDWSVSSCMFSVNTEEVKTYDPSHLFLDAYHTGHNLIRNNTSKN